MLTYTALPTEDPEDTNSKQDVADGSDGGGPSHIALMLRWLTTGWCWRQLISVLPLFYARRTFQWLTVTVVVLCLLVLTTVRITDQHLPRRGLFRLPQAFMEDEVLYIDEKENIPARVNLTDSESKKLLSDLYRQRKTGKSNASRPDFSRTTTSNASSHVSSTPAPPSSGKCSKGPVNKLGFMKTHKTASSTIQNILLRYGKDHDWNFVMYKTGNHLGPPQNQYQLSRPFQARWLDNVPWKPMTDSLGYNAFVEHTMWDQKEVEKLIGKDAAYFTIIRNPVDQFESMYNYVHFEKQFKMGLEEFVQTYIKKQLPVKKINGYLGRNQQFYDLGYSSFDLQTTDMVKEKILEISNNFDLVLLSEDFSASLVLLSDLLCWPLEAFSSLKLNARKPSAVEKLSNESRQLLKDWLWADQLLYDYFKTMMEEKKRKYGEARLEADIHKLEAFNQELQDRCVKKVVKNTDALDPDFQPWSKDVYGFQVDESIADCKFYAWSENQMINHVRKLQIGRWLDWAMVNGADYD